MKKLLVVLTAFALVLGFTIGCTGATNDMSECDKGEEKGECIGDKECVDKDKCEDENCVCDEEATEEVVEEEATEEEIVEEETPVEEDGE